MRPLGTFWLVLLLAPPLLALALLPSFGIHVVTMVGIQALMGVGYQLVFGHLGALNLAQGALFGIGAYSVALTAPAIGLLSFPLAAIVAGGAAALAAWPTLRLRSHAFALATLALATLVNIVALNAESVTGEVARNSYRCLSIPTLGRQSSARRIIDAQFRQRQHELSRLMAERYEAVVTVDGRRTLVLGVHHQGEHGDFRA